MMEIHRAEWAVRHQLESVEVRLSVPKPGFRAGVVIQGRSSGKRDPLWVLREDFLPDDEYGAADFINHVMMVALQDAPRNEADLNRAMLGGAQWEDVQLPF